MSQPLAVGQSPEKWMFFKGMRICFIGKFSKSSEYQLDKAMQLHYHRHSPMENATCPP
ncbi:hypothetical protein [Limnohabitans sp. T6-5]|uniref:hypothetical protein n=1 Tax=Limnohabitans sp. T6-5 TaxID=1100724 RepID=UPI001E43BDC8|nr:hypothetical protein [Limnohabitans sp. T6-5]